MRHLKTGRKLKRTSSHKKALMRNLATALVTHKKIHTTLAKAKELRPYIEKLITRAKKSYIKEQNNLLSEGNKIDVHSRRVASTYVFGKGAVQALFDEIAPKVIERAGGYTRIIKTGIRQGDSASTAIIQLVDWYDIQDGAVSKKRRKKVAAKPKAAKPATTPAEQSEVAKVEEPVATAEIVEEAPQEATVDTTTETLIVEEVAVEAQAEVPTPTEVATEQAEETVKLEEVAVEAPTATVTPEEVQPSDEVEEVKVKKAEE